MLEVFALFWGEESFISNPPKQPQNPKLKNSLGLYSFLNGDNCSALITKVTSLMIKI